MTGQQHAVMWLGVLLIIVRLFTTTQFDQLKAIFGWTDAQTGNGGSGAPAQDPLKSGVSIFSKVYGYVGRDILGKGIT